mgnify:FL=1
MYECWNPNCPNYAGAGVRLGENDVEHDVENRLHCSTCKAFVRVAPTSDDAAKAVTGAAGGALVGWTVGGPPGAAIGGLLGLIVGAVSGSRGR